MVMITLFRRRRAPVRSLAEVRTWVDALDFVEANCRPAADYSTTSAFAYVVLHAARGRRRVIPAMGFLAGLLSSYSPRALVAELQGSAEREVRGFVRSALRFETYRGQVRPPGDADESAALRAALEVLLARVQRDYGPCIIPRGPR